MFFLSVFLQDFKLNVAPRRFGNKTYHKYFPTAKTAFHRNEIKNYHVSQELKSIELSEHKQSFKHWLEIPNNIHISKQHIT